MLLLCFAVPTLAQKPSLETILTYAEKSGETTWRKVQERDPSLSSREIYRYALVLCETGNHPDRLAPLFQTAAQMQDRDPNSRGYGNFHWRLSEDAVRDFNAVEFCMQSASLIWLRHKETLPPDAHTTLKETLDFALEGSLRHGVRESYTNIALMNAGNLILLGESMNRPKAVTEGQRRLELAAQYTYRYGTHEYVSPTYYGVNLEVLSIIHAFAKNNKSRELAHALLELMWTDTALNYFPPAQRLAGTHSRSYDYLRGLGHLDTSLWVEGWLDGRQRGGTNTIYQALATYHPSKQIRELANQYPRLIRQSWDVTSHAARTHYILPDITLSTSGANYRAQDIMLAIDFPGPRESVRGYFIPDGRQDPYGKKRIAAGNHQKALHLTPLWRATQQKQDALGIVTYRPEDIPETSTTLESHIVLPANNDGLYINDRPISLTSTPTITLSANDALILKKGSATVGIRVPHATRQDGTPATIQLINDHNNYGAIRLSVSHFSPTKTHTPTAAFWVRVGSTLTTETDFQTWQKQFIAATPFVTDTTTNLNITVPSPDGALQLTQTGNIVTPSHTTAVLEYNGQDIGKNILDQVTWFTQDLTQNQPDTLTISTQGTYIEAESGLIISPIVTGQDLQASQGQYIWMPGKEGARGGSDLGSVSYPLQVPQEGIYYIWARVLTPTPDDDSFYIRIYNAQEQLVPRSDWHMRQHPTWTWIPLTLQSDATGFQLPSGTLHFELRVREDGAKIDQLYITPNANDTPQDVPLTPQGNTDFNNDGATNFADFVLFVHAFGATPNMPNYVPNMDLNASNSIDLTDFILFALQYNQPAPTHLSKRHPRPKIRATNAPPAHTLTHVNAEFKPSCI